MARKKKRPRPIPDIEIIETLQPAPANLDFGTKEKPKHWYLVWTTPRGEAKAAKGLAEAGCQVFWPHFERVIRRKNKPEITNLISTFPRYLFASGAPMRHRSRDRVLTDNTVITIDGRPLDDIREIDGIISVVSNSRGWCTVPRAAIEKIAEMHGDHPGPVSSAAPARAKPKSGERVTILDGPFMGFFATIVDELGPDDGIILIDMFGGQVKAEIGMTSIAAA